MLKQSSLHQAGSDGSGRGLPRVKVALPERGPFCRWEVNWNQLTLLNHHCCLCGLLCPVPMCWPSERERHLPECERLRAWLSAQDAHRGSAQPHEDPGTFKERVAAQARGLARARNPLLWIESADVSAVRAAVRLAELCEATVHVAESPGAHNVAKVTSTSGILGTSLAEVWQHADVLVHIGHEHLHEMPLLAPRFLKAGGVGQPPTGRRHVFIDDDAAAALLCAAEMGINEASGGAVLLNWPRSQWLDQLTRLLMHVRGNAIPAAAPQHRGSAVAPQLPEAELEQLAELLAGSRYAVFLWCEELFADEADRWLVERLLEIASKLTAVTRCSLLPLGVDPGRTTGKETLLWLTNHATTACCVDGRWSKPHLGDNVDLDDWRRQHDWILALRTLPSDRPLPDLKFNLIVDAACNYSQHATDRASSQTAAETIGVAAVGLDCSGHVTRVDHAFGAHVTALAQAEMRYPTAAQVMTELATAYRAAGGREC